jgi:hypothetical protein
VCGVLHENRFLRLRDKYAATTPNGLPSNQDTSVVVVAVVCSMHGLDSSLGINLKASSLSPDIERKQNAWFTIVDRLLSGS